VVDRRVGGGQVDAAVADVGDALIADRPRGVVHVVAAEGEPHRVGHQLVVVARGPLRPADHADRVLLLDRAVGAVVRGRAGLAGAGRPGVLQGAVDVDLALVGGGTGHRDHRVADGEALGQVGGAVHSAGPFDPGQVPGQRDLGVGRPVVLRPEVQVL